MFSKSPTISLLFSVSFFPKYQIKVSNACLNIEKRLTKIRPCFLSDRSTITSYALSLFSPNQMFHERLARLSINLPMPISSLECMYVNVDEGQIYTCDAIWRSTRIQKSLSTWFLTNILWPPSFPLELPILWRVWTRAKTMKMIPTFFPFHKLTLDTIVIVFIIGLFLP